MNAKRLAALIVLAITAAGGALGYTEWRKHQLPEAVLPHVKNVTFRVENSLSHELRDTNVTYGELFESLGKHITEIDSTIIDVQSVATSKNRAVVEPVLEYMRAAQELLRAQQSLYRKQLQLNASLEMFSEAVAELRDASYYGYEFARRSADRAEAQSKKANAEHSEAVTAFKVELDAFIKARARAATVVPEDFLPDATLPRKVIDKVHKAAAA